VDGSPDAISGIGAGVGLERVATILFKRPDPRAPLTHRLDKGTRWRH